MTPRLPAEFEPVRAVWLARPHNRETWPGCLDAAAAQHAAFVEVLERRVQVELIGRDHPWPTRDAWIRDYAPFVVMEQSSGQRLCHDFRFDGWGGRYGDEYRDDDRIAAHMARYLGLPSRRHEMVLEGGAIDTNGQHTALGAATALFDPARNPNRVQMRIEQSLKEMLGLKTVIWLRGLLTGDDTGGHVDQVARFVGPATVLACRAPEGHPDHEALDANWATLREARTQEGSMLETIPLPMPEPPLLYDYPPDRFDAGGRSQLPASYANFVFVNDTVVVPTFGRPTDETALARISEALPERHVVGVRSEWLIVGQGGLHCLSWQQPA